MRFSRQVKIWFVIALAHASLIYLFSRADAVEIAHTLVSATVVTTAPQPQLNAEETERAFVEKLMNTQTVMNQKALADVSHPNEVKSNASAPSNNYGVQKTATNSALTPITSARTLTQSLNQSVNETANSAQTKFTAPTHIGGHLHNPKPPYPVLSQDAGEQGVVTLSAMVEASGQPSSVDVVKSSGYTRLDRSARDTVLNQYRFIPATQGGHAIRYRYRFDIHFNLQKT